MRRPSLSEQLDNYATTSEVATEMVQARLDTMNEVRKMLADAERKYQEAAAMHFPGKVQFYGGQIAALKAVIEVLVAIAARSIERRK